MLNPTRYLLASGLAMAALAVGAASAPAATVDNLGPLINYDAGFNEINTVTLETDGAFGSPDFALKFTDLAGLSGCDPIPGGSSVSRRCVLAPTFVELAVELGARDDKFTVDTDPLALVSPTYEVHGRIGDDDLFGGPERSLLHGDDGTDTIFSGAGDDSLFGGGGRDGMAGGPGEDGLFGGTHPDTMFGEGGNDLLEGQDGDDSLNGGSGRDTLRGLGGADLLHANDGERDTVDCGAGQDRARVDVGNLDTVINCETVDPIPFT
jgi:Ca2+-binding RTX toxin-like protein